MEQLVMTKDETLPLPSHYDIFFFSDDDDDDDDDDDNEDDDDDDEDDVNDWIIAR